MEMLIALASMSPVHIEELGIHVFARRFVLTPMPYRWPCLDPSIVQDNIAAELFELIPRMLADVTATAVV